jgi:(4S)-4-hydroxy-5-phosphonooxypentane-2,3-dione isomerase
MIAVLQQSKNSKELEPWCHEFDVCTLPDKPSSVLLYETYDDRAAFFEKHRQTEHFANFQREIDGCVASKEVGVWDIRT